jgi:hypothetical protein
LNLALIAHKRQLVAAHIGVIIDGQIVLYPPFSCVTSIN